MIINNARIILPEKIVESGSIFIKNKLIEKIEDKVYQGESNDIFDAKGLTVIPGLIDLHIHGANGFSITDRTDDSLLNLSNSLVKFGITGFLWTTMAVPVDEMDWVMQQVADFNKGNGAFCYGVNIEGSFISDKRPGSHLTSCIFPADISMLDRWVKLSKSNIRVVTIAPEKTSDEFIKYMLKNNIIPSIGHSYANYEQTLKALESGASYFTHLGNATGTLHQREPGIIGAALLDENSMIEIICDGVHLHSAVVKIFTKVKGWNNVVLVSDGTCVMGMKPGNYKWYDDYAKYDGTSLTLENGTIAGGVLPLNKALQNIMKFTDCSVVDAVKMTSAQPAIKLGIYDMVGSIETGKMANIAIVDDNYETHYTFIEGKLVYSK